MSVGKKENQEEFEFVTQKIKKKNSGIKKQGLHVILLLISAVAFGVVASFTFVLSRPWVEELIKDQDTDTKVSLEDGENQDQDLDSELEDQDNQFDLASDLEDPSQEDSNQSELTVSGIDISDYEKLHNKMFKVNQKVNRSLVMVTGVNRTNEWFQNTVYEEEAVGLIIAQNSAGYYILTEYDVARGKSQIRVTFSNNVKASASLRAYDEATELAVLLVTAEESRTLQKDFAVPAVLGNSNLLRLGNPVMALGDLTGTGMGMGIGSIMRIEETNEIQDGVFRVIRTNITGVSSASGVLVNLDGKILGILRPALSSKGMQNSMTAIGISGLKSLIEKLSNNEAVARLGIKGVSVTEEIKENREMPNGVYVQQIVERSGAMLAGIQAGDILVSFGGQEISSMTDLQETLEEYRPNDEVVVIIRRQYLDQYTQMKFTVTLQ